MKPTYFSMLQRLKFHAAFATPELEAPHADTAGLAAYLARFLAAFKSRSIRRAEAERRAAAKAEREARDRAKAAALALAPADRLALALAPADRLALAAVYRQATAWRGRRRGMRGRAISANPWSASSSMPGCKRS